MAPLSLPFVKLLKKYWSTFIFPIPPLLLLPKCCNLLSVHFPLLAWHTPRKSVTSWLPNPVGIFSNYLTSFCAECLAVLPLTCIFFLISSVGSSILFKYHYICDESQSETSAQPSKFQPFTSNCVLYMPTWKFFLGIIYLTYPNLY